MIMGQELEYRHIIRSPHTQKLCENSAANEFSRLMQGLKRGKIQATETMRFIKRRKVPHGRQVTYAKYVCEYKPNKQERTKITIGGDHIDYPREVATKSADITTIKCLLNSIISTENGCFATADVKNFYLKTPMARPDYMQIKIEFIPQEIRDKYQVDDKIIDNHVYVKINKGMYGLPQAASLPINNWQGAWTNMAFGRQHTRPAYRSTTVAPSSLHWWWTTLASNTSIKVTLTSFSTYFANIMKMSPSSGKEKSSVA